MRQCPPLQIMGDPPLSPRDLCLLVDKCRVWTLKKRVNSLVYDEAVRYMRRPPRGCWYWTWRSFHNMDVPRSALTANATPLPAHIRWVLRGFLAAIVNIRTTALAPTKMHTVMALFRYGPFIPSWRITIWYVGGGSVDRGVSYERRHRVIGWTHCRLPQSKFPLNRVNAKRTTVNIS